MNKELLQLQAAIDEADVRLADTAKAELDFTRDVIHGPVHPVRARARGGACPRGWEAGARAAPWLT